jgi:hypothetical protein
MRFANENESRFNDLFENVRNLFVMNSSESRNEQEYMKSLLNQRFEFLDKLINAKFYEYDKRSNERLATLMSILR